jgi:hypothetical protein
VRRIEAEEREVLMVRLRRRVRVMGMWMGRRIRIEGLDFVRRFESVENGVEGVLTFGRYDDISVLEWDQLNRKTWDNG